jgi:hypothetical protein
VQIRRWSSLASSPLPGRHPTRTSQVGYAWQVQVDLFVVWGPPDGASPDPSASPIWIYYLIDVDRRTGLPSIFAQG